MAPLVHASCVVGLTMPLVDAPYILLLLLHELDLVVVQALQYAYGGYLTRSFSFPLSFSPRFALLLLHITILPWLGFLFLAELGLRVGHRLWVGKLHSTTTSSTMPLPSREQLASIRNHRQRRYGSGSLPPPVCSLDGH